MNNVLKNWADNLKITPSQKGNDKQWEKIAGRIKTKKQKPQTFWDSKVLLIAIVLLSAIFGSIIIIQGLTPIKNLFGV
jgi:hypothetical protein